jgi:hypothetical protein
MDWPASINGLEGVIAPASRTGLTVTVSPEEHAEAGVRAESVTL